MVREFSNFSGEILQSEIRTYGIFFAWDEKHNN